MKFKSLIAAATVAAFSLNAVADLNETTGKTYAGALPVGIVANDAVFAALQAIQLPDCTAGDNSKACMPSISTMELGGLVQTSGLETWTNMGLTDSEGNGVFQEFYDSVYVCGTPAEEVTRVAARHIGVGCGTEAPDGVWSAAAGSFATQADVASCMATLSSYTLGAIAFATATDTTAGYNFVKLDGQSPDLANFAAGNYSMFADVHTTDGSLGIANVEQDWGTAGAIAAANNPPMHVQSGNVNLSNECAPGRLRDVSATNFAE